MKTFARNVVLLCLTMITACESRTPIYRANVKLLITRSSATAPVNDSTREDADRFVAAQSEVLLGANILRRTQERMNKTVEEVRNNLAGLTVTPVRGSDIFVVSVDSPSAGFAKGFADSLVSEYLKFRDEQRVLASEGALSPLIQETRRLSQELKAINEKIATFDKEHNVSSNAELWELQALFESRERVQGLYDASRAQLMKADAARSAHDRYVSVLEPATLERDRVH